MARMGKYLWFLLLFCAYYPASIRAGPQNPNVTMDNPDVASDEYVDYFFEDMDPAAANGSIEAGNVLVMVLV